MSSVVQTEEIAARWLLRREEDDWSSEDQMRLDAWLDASPQHKVTFWRLESGWQKVDRLASLRRPGASEPHAAPTRKAWKPAVVGGLLAACLVAAAVLILPATGLVGGDSYATDIGGRATAPLADGTKVELNTQTKLRAAVTRKGREVWLDRGEAYFEVAHDASRPFVVHAGPKTVTVLGTKFSVRRDGDRVEVAVVEGRVRVADTGSARVKPALLTRGDMVIADGASTLVATTSVERVASVLTWRQGLLSFDQSTLSDAAQEFNRYNRKTLVIGDPQAGAMRIGGSFEAENVEAFVRLLQEAYGLKVEDNGDSVKISS
jgi:transmembrane sensor